MTETVRMTADRRCRRAGDIRKGARYRTGFAAALALALLPGAAHAGVWEAFETRCLAAFEDFAPAVVAGLAEGTRDGDVTRYALGGGHRLIVEQAPGDGRRACAVQAAAGADAPGFDAWIARATATGRYAAVAPGRWRSTGWIEPVLEIRRTETGGMLALRILETRLET